MIVGDSSIGKTCLANVFFENFYLGENSTPTTTNEFSTLLKVKGKTVKLVLWDTSGLAEHDLLRPLTYVNLDVMIICYSVDAPSSLSNVSQKWAQDAQQFCQNVPVVLVGNKKDIRDQLQNINVGKLKKSLPGNLVAGVPEPIMLSREQGVATAKEIGAVAFFECSAKKKENVDKVFFTAISATMPTGRRNKKCFGCCCF